MLHRLFRFAGFGLVAVSLLFVGMRLLALEPSQLDSRLVRAVGLASLAGACLYVLASFALSVAWRCLLGDRVRDLPAAALHAVYGRTQIAKYIPGNVFHFAGRHVLGRRLGLSDAVLLRAALLEVAGVVWVAAALALFALWLWRDLARVADGFGAAMSGLALGSALLLLISILYSSGLGRRLLPSRWELPQASGSAAARDLGLAYLIYCVFFLLAGVALWFLVVSVANVSKDVPAATWAVYNQLAYCTAVFALAWIVGFLTPGASAGVGIREVVLIVALDEVIGSPGSVVVAAAMRLVTVVGDALFFLICLALPLSVPRKTF